MATLIAGCPFLTTIALELRNAVFQHLFSIRCDLEFNLNENEDLYVKAEGAPATQILRTCHALYKEGKSLLDAAIRSALAANRVLLDHGESLQDLSNFAFFDKYIAAIEHLDIQQGFEDYEDGFEAMTSLKSVTLNYHTEIELLPNGLPDEEKEIFLGHVEGGANYDSWLQDMFQSQIDVHGHDNILDVSGEADAWVEYAEKKYGTERTFKMYAIVGYDVLPVGFLVCVGPLGAVPPLTIVIGSNL